jgi:hypothetical protein
MPLDHHLQRMLMHDLELSYADVAADEDGDYPLRTESGVRVYARLIHEADQVGILTETATEIGELVQIVHGSHDADESGAPAVRDLPDVN